MAKRGQKPWITPPSEDGGKSLSGILERIKAISQYTDTEREIIHQMKTNADTWYRYKKIYLTEFTDALEAGWDNSLLIIKKSLMKKAMDGDFNSQKLVLERKGGWKEEQVRDHKGIPTAMPVIIKLNMPKKNEVK